MIYIEYENTSKSEYMETVIRTVIREAIAYVNCPYPCEVNVLLTDNRVIHELNQTHRGIDRPTDVLSFPMASYKKEGDFSGFLEEQEDCFNPETGELILGDIVISLERAKEQSLEYGHSFLREIAFLTAHSMLHLFGYDHMEEDERLRMEAKQDEILDRLGYTRDMKDEIEYSI